VELLRLIDLNNVMAPAVVPVNADIYPVQHNAEVQMVFVMLQTFVLVQAELVPPIHLRLVTIFVDLALEFVIQLKAALAPPPTVLVMHGAQLFVVLQLMSVMSLNFVLQLLLIAQLIL